MTLQHWLRQQVDRLEREIRESALFEGAEPAPHDALLRLRRKAAIHAFLEQELHRREQHARRQKRIREDRMARTARVALRIDTQEVPLPACVH